MENNQILVDLNELYKDEAFLKKVVSAENPDQVKALFLEKGLELDDEAAKAFLETVRKGADGELDESDLEAVSGGFMISGTILAVACFGAVLGVGLGIGVCKLDSIKTEMENSRKKCK